MRSLFATLFLSLAFAANAQTVIADSLLDFSGTQEAGGWSYRYYDKTNDATPDAYDYQTEAQLMTEYVEDHQKWYVQQGMFWTMIGKNAAHGNGVVTSGGRSAVEQMAIRRWTSDYTGMARISGEVSKINFSGGNGVEVFLRINGVTEHSAWIAGSDFIGTTFTIDRPLHAGDAVEWWLDSYQGNDLFDLTYYTGTVAAVPEPSAVIALAVGIVGFCYRGRRSKSA